MSSKSVKPFVRALFDLAQERKVLDQIRPDLQHLLELIRQSSDFKNFLNNSSVPLEKQKAVLRNISKTTHALVQTFLLFLADHKRLDWLEDILQEFEAFYLSHTGVLKVTVIAPFAPNKNQLDQISAKLAQAFQKKIQISVEINPDLIGGFQIAIGDFIQDFSIQTQLDRFEQSVMAV